MEIDVVTVALCVEQEAHVSREPYEKMQQPLANSLFRAIHEFAGAHRTSKESPKLADYFDDFSFPLAKLIGKGHRSSEGSLSIQSSAKNCASGPMTSVRHASLAIPCTLIEMPSRPCS